MTKINLLTGSVFTAISLSGSALAGDVVAEAPAASTNNGSWCDNLKTIGKVYSNKENPLIQELTFSGRYQFQTGSISGEDVNGDSFNENFTTHRRLRLGAQMKFANYFKLKANVNLVADASHTKTNPDIPGSGETNWGFPDAAAAVYDEAKITFDAGKAFGTAGLDSLSITYGRQKLKMSQEAHNSSKKIKTIERSALANTIYRSARPVGVTIDGAKGSWKGAVAVFSDQISDTEWGSVGGGWGEGTAYYASATKTFSNDDALILDFIHHDDDNDETNLDWIGYDWAASAAYQATRGRWGYIVNAIVGDHGDVYSSGSLKEDRGGLFYGAILTGTYWITEGTLEAVAQYQWQGSEESEGVRTNSRYFRADNDGDVNSGRGDSHHSLYAGLNWYICGDNSKFMTGVEYQQLETADGDADAATLLLAYRMYF
mgnify:CR=1 FL=1